MRKVWKASLLMLATACVFVTGCCKTGARIDVVRGMVPPSVKTGGSKQVFVCPGEQVTLGWLVSGDVTAASVNTLGNVTIPMGFKTVTANDDIKYTIKASGECERTDSCEVNVVKEGDKAQIAANLVVFGKPEMYYWEASLTEDIWSENIMFTSIRMVLFSDAVWNGPQTWKFLKTDKDGTVHDFPVKFQFSTPWPSPLPAVGNYKMVPVFGGVIPSNTPPEIATFEATMKCK
jgi:hypothetical protein